MSIKKFMKFANSSKFNHWHNIFLRITSISIGLTTAYSLIVSSAGNHSVSSFSFPQRIELPAWQLISSKSFNIGKNSEVSNRGKERVKSAQNYTYIKNGDRLNINVRYIVGTRGDVYEYFYIYTDIPYRVVNRKNKTKNMKYREEIGYYLLFNDGKRAYLSSCTNPDRENNVTQAQFSQNLNDIDWQSEIWLNWLLGKSVIRDRRCLWTYLSMPIDKSNLRDVYQILETAWIDWYDLWKPGFPRL